MAGGVPTHPNGEKPTRQSTQSNCQKGFPGIKICKLAVHSRNKTMRISEKHLHAWLKSIHHKSVQTKRLSKKTLDFMTLLIGAFLVAMAALFFAKIADWANEKNAEWTSAHPLAAFVMLPLGLVAILWVTRRHAPYTSGSGIPQVIAALGALQTRHKGILLGFTRTMLKIPLTFLAMLFGASVGREGPSVQVGAAVMGAWGEFCNRHGLSFTKFKSNDLYIAGAGGGIAAAFNAPLSGVIFAIEELGKGRTIQWERQVLLGVLATGFFLIAIDGNNHYFNRFVETGLPSGFVFLVLTVGFINGLMGGFFARLLAKGPQGYLPKKIGGWISSHPYMLAFLMGLLIATIGFLYGGKTYGTGYNIGSEALAGEAPGATGISIAKFLATVFSYWAGIPGGIFSPCLSIGAGVGAEFSHLMGVGEFSSMIVLVSMAAFLAGATQSPVTSSVIMMEMTGHQPMLFWILLGSIFASFISRQICPHAFYHLQAGKFRRRVLEDVEANEKEAKKLKELAQKKAELDAISKKIDEGASLKDITKEIVRKDEEEYRKEMAGETAESGGESPSKAVGEATPGAAKEQKPDKSFNPSKEPSANSSVTNPEKDTGEDKDKGKHEGAVASYGKLGDATSSEASMAKAKTPKPEASSETPKEATLGRAGADESLAELESDYREPPHPPKGEPKEEGKPPPKPTIVGSQDELDNP